MPNKDNKTTKDRFQNHLAMMLKMSRNNVWRQAALALLTVVLAAILIFAMSAAWYTNVVKTGDLIFQVEQWGFSGSVEIGDVPILAAPGDSGIIDLSMTNGSNDMVAANVSILKSTMSTDMQKRLYFYADTSAVVNGETVERVYLTSNQSHTYQIFSQGVLTLSETVSNDVQLKWFWVYDVLGYYVQGVLEENKVTVSEYLRPVEYSYDEAKTTFDEAGKLLTIDGETSVEAYLEELSRTDGYEGVITVDENKWTEDGFYPISVDENGKGVWIKFLPYSEIEKEIITDTAMGTGQQPVEAKARVTITAENVLLKMEKINTVAQLQEQLLQEGLVVLQLTENIAVDQLTVSGNTRAIIDLNGKTISGTADKDTILVEEGGSLTLMDGQMEGAGKKYAITHTGAEITLSNVKVSDYERAVVVQDHLGEADSTVRLVGCDINTSDVSLFVRGNADKTEAMTRLILENTKVNSGYAAICGNGNTNTWGTDIQIINSELTGYYTAIYQPQKESTITVSSGSVLTGYTGIALKAGSLYVMDSSVIGTGEQGAPRYAVSGFSDTGDGIYVEANYGHDILVEVSGDSVITGTQENTYAVQVYEKNAPNVTVRIFGGSFSTSVADFLADNRAQTQIGGRFVVREAPEPDEDTLEQIQEQLQTDGLVVLKLTESIAVDQLRVSGNTQAVIDLNGKTITGSADQDTFVVEEGGSLTLKNGQMVGAGKKYAISNTGAEISLNNVDISGYERAVMVQDHLGEADSTIQLIGCNIDTTEVSVFIRGNGEKTAAKTLLVIENTTINSGYAAVCGNGNPDTWGTDIQIINSKLTGRYAAIYQPQKESTITVSSGSVLTGYTGIALKAGSLYVMDSSVIGTGEHGAPSYAVSGFSDTGDGIYVEANYGHDILVEVSGNSVITGTDTNTHAVQVYEQDAPNVTVQIFGGSFSTSVAGFLADNRTETQTDGRFVVTEVNG